MSAEYFTCVECATPKPIREFAEEKTLRLGHRATCRACRSAQARKRRLCNLEESRAKDRARYASNPEKFCARRRAFHAANKEKFRQWRIDTKAARSKRRKELREANLAEFNRKQRAYIARRKEKRREYLLRHEAKNPNRKIKSRLSSRIRCALKATGVKKLAKTTELIGCSIEAFRLHLQSLFKPGMSWANYGAWHIDHEKPCARFNLREPEQQRECFNFKNLQPLWAAENLSKGARA